MRIFAQILITAALAAGMAAPVAAQLKPSSPDAVADAVVDCWASVGPKTVDRAALSQRGWKAGTITSAKGKPATTPLEIYGKAGSNVMIMLMGAEAAPLCSIMSRVNSVADVSLAAQAAQRRLTAADPKVGTARSGRSIVFLSLPRIAILDSTGTKAEPALRVVVQFQNSEKK